jgi:hypothetical protein
MTKSSAWGICAPLRARLWRQEHGLYPASPAGLVLRSRPLDGERLWEASSCERSKHNLGKLILCLQHSTSNNIPGRGEKIHICPRHCGGRRRCSFCFASERTMTVEFIVYFPARVGKSERGVVRFASRGSVAQAMRDGHGHMTFTPG